METISIIDEYKKKLKQLEEEMKSLGLEMGWMTDDPDDPYGIFGPLMREGFGEASMLELKKFEKEADAKKSLEFYHMFAKWYKVKKKIIAMEKGNEDISEEEEKTSLPWQIISSK